MKRKWNCVSVWAQVLIVLGSMSMAAEELPPLRLPAPRLDRGVPLMRAMQQRRTIREYSLKPVPPLVLSEMLWAACGVNRPDTGHRTAPTAMNSQEIDVYVATAEALYLYEAGTHQLKPILAEDIRIQTGGQEYIKQAPLALIFVADLSRLAKAEPEQRERYAGIDTGYVSQNVYLYCASEGLATVVHEVSDRKGLAAKMRLRPGQSIILAQSVGYPK